MNVAVCNHIGDESVLAGLGLGALTAGILVENPSQGFAYAVAKCVAQSYGHADLRACRIYRNQYLFLSGCVMLTLCIPLIFIPTLLTLIGQDQKLVDFATQYIWIVIPGLFLHNQGFV